MMKRWPQPAYASPNFTFSRNSSDDQPIHQPLESSALGQTLRPLTREGFIGLGHDKRDGRRRPIKLTKAGKDKVVRGRRYWAGAHEKFKHVFGNDQLVVLRETLRDIAESAQLPEAFQ